MKRLQVSLTSRLSVTGVT